MRPVIQFLIILFSVPFSSYSQLSFIHNGQQLNPYLGGNVRMGDFNGDGNVDALASNRDYCRIYFGNGNGLFTDGGQCLSTPSSCAVGDINDDGRLEVITDKTIWLNDGNGHFTADARSVDSLETEELGTAELADLNGDGHLDLFVIRGIAAMRVYFNDGTGHFHNSGQTLGDGTIGTGQLAHIALGDLNGDGAVDAVTAGWRWPPGDTGPCPNRVWFNDGSGNFHESGQLLDEGQSHVHGLKLGDLNGDGRLDLVMGIQDDARSGRIYLNDGTGHFIAGANLTGSSGENVALCDFDGDGVLDIYSAQSFTPSDRVWLGNGDGTFYDSGLRLGNTMSWDVGVGDFNGDQRIDVFTVCLTYNGQALGPAPARIWLNKQYQCNYLGETPPGTTPQLFGAGKVSVGSENTHACSFFPDGSLLIFSRYPERKSYVMTFVDSLWTDPAEAFFQGKEASFSPYGEKVFYYQDDGDIYYSPRTDSSWGNSVSVGSTINTSATEFYPSATYDGTLFFSRNGNWNEGRILYSVFNNGAYGRAFDLGVPVNRGGALHAYVSPDQKYMLFNSPRPGSNTQLDIWISYKRNSGWTNPKNLGGGINSGADAILCPTVTPDGKFMFFTKLDLATNTGNIYWVGTSFIDSLLATNFIPYLRYSLPDQIAAQGEMFRYVLPTNMFYDDDGNETLTYSATGIDGTGLPSWLSFDSLSGTLSGIPDTAEVFEIVIKAADTCGAETADTIRLTVTSPTDVGSNETSLPRELMLQQNYPNPFNPATMVTYRLATSGNTRLIVYNLLGQKIKTLVDSYQNEGKHSTVWEGDDDYNAPVSSGMYFYRLEAGDRILQKKMILIR